MVYTCLVKDCRNYSKVNMKKLKMFRVPKDELLCKDWLINCNRQDLLVKSIIVLNKFYRVCKNHFKNNMFANPDKTILLPKAVPTEFSLIYEGVSSVDMNAQNKNSTEYSVMNVSEQVLFDSVVTSIPSKQTPSTSNMCVQVSQSSVDNSLTSTSTAKSTQTTQILSLHTPRKEKYRSEIREMKKKYAELKQKLKTISQQLERKNSADVDVTSVDLLNRVVEAQLPHNLCMVIKHYVQINKRNPKAGKIHTLVKQN